MATQVINTDTAVEMYFFLVDATDGITAETGEAGGQPQVSKNGAAWTTNGVSTLTHIGNGQYYCTVDLTNGSLSVAVGDILIARYKSANTAEGPSLNSIQVVSHEPSSAVAEVLARIGGFAGTSSNTIFGWLQSFFRKDLTAPTQVGGTFDTSTDSAEAQSDRITGGATFSPSRNSLTALRSFIEQSLLPQVVQATSDVTANSYLSRIIGIIRKAVDEPSVNAKYMDSDLILQIQAAWAEIWVDLHQVTKHPILVEMPISIEEGVRDYILPPSVGRVYRFAHVNETTGVVDREVTEHSLYNSFGHGVRIEGNMLRLGATWNTPDDYTLFYTPSGEIMPITGSYVSDVIGLVNNLPLVAGHVTDGTLDTRPNAYAGYLFRTIPGEGDPPQEERLVVSNDATTGVYVLAKDLTHPLTAAPDHPINFELVPFAGLNLEWVVAFRAAQTILSFEGNDKRLAVIDREYVRKIRAARLYLSSVMERRVGRFESDTVDNPRRRHSAFFNL